MAQEHSTVEFNVHHVSVAIENERPVNLSKDWWLGGCMHLHKSVPVA